MLSKNLTRLSDEPSGIDTEVQIVCIVSQHYGTRHYGAPFECGAIFGKNLDPRLIRGLNRD